MNKPNKSINALDELASKASSTLPKQVQLPPMVEGISKDVNSDTGTKSTKRDRKARYISRSAQDRVAEIYLAHIQDGSEEAVRPSVKIPESLYSDIKLVVNLKRQTFQEYVLGLILTDMGRLEKRGLFTPIAKQLTLDKD